VVCNLLKSQSIESFTQTKIAHGMAVLHYQWSRCAKLTLLVAALLVVMITQQPDANAANKKPPPWMVKRAATVNSLLMMRYSPVLSDSLVAKPANGGTDQGSGLVELARLYFVEPRAQACSNPKIVQAVTKALARELPKNVVSDLRNNPGGLTCRSLIAAYKQWTNNLFAQSNIDPSDQQGFYRYSKEARDFLYPFVRGAIYSPRVKIKYLGTKILVRGSYAVNYTSSDKNVVTRHRVRVLLQLNNKLRLTDFIIDYKIVVLKQVGL